MKIPKTANINLNTNIVLNKFFNKEDLEWIEDSDLSQENVYSGLKELIYDRLDEIINPDTLHITFND